MWQEQEKKKFATERHSSPVLVKQAKTKVFSNRSHIVQIWPLQFFVII